MAEIIESELVLQARVTSDPEEQLSLAAALAAVLVEHRRRCGGTAQFPGSSSVDSRWRTTARREQQQS